MVYRNGIFAGTLTEEADKTYTFTYDDAYYNDDRLPAVSLTLPKTAQRHTSPYLFPFFSGLLAEGVNKRLQLQRLRIDEADSFGRLLVTAQYDTVGAVTIKPKANHG